MPTATQFGAGKLTITMGSWDKTGDQFSNPGTPVEIDIAAGAKLEDVVQAINSKGTGVVASVLSVVIAMSYGIPASWWMGVACYAVALVAIRRATRLEGREVETPVAVGV